MSTVTIQKYIWNNVVYMLELLNYIEVLLAYQWSTLINLSMSEAKLI